MNEQNYINVLETFKTTLENQAEPISEAISDGVQCVQCITARWLGWVQMDSSLQPLQERALVFLMEGISAYDRIEGLILASSLRPPDAEKSIKLIMDMMAVAGKYQKPQTEMLQGVPTASDNRDLFIEILVHDINEALAANSLMFSAFKKLLVAKLPIIEKMPLPTQDGAKDMIASLVEICYEAKSKLNMTVSPGDLTEVCKTELAAFEKQHILEAKAKGMNIHEAMQYSYSHLCAKHCAISHENKQEVKALPPPMSCNGCRLKETCGDRT